ncbi:AraC family transcriptional regulator [Vibrio hippocampi]|nr:AraC family transcriptional regulator [Vibrio hippocampi]
MNRAIEFSSDCYDYLTITARKKTLCNQLLRVEKGSLFIKLGQLEYTIEAGSSLWIPQECLTSLTILPNTTLSRLCFSVRLLDTFPFQAGQVKLDKLCEAVLDRLAQGVSAEVQADLLQVTRHEVKSLKPKLEQTELCQKVSQWRPDNRQVTKQLDVILRVREARKMALSGAKADKISQALFAGDLSLYQSLCQTLLGTSESSR